MVWEGGALYQVVSWWFGSWSCDCADWVNRRSKSIGHGEQADDHCKHIRTMIQANKTVAAVAVDRPLSARAIVLSSDEVV